MFSKTLILIATIISWLTYQGSTSIDLVVVEIAGQNLKVEIADTPATRQRGLSGRADLPSAQGLLFVFETPGIYGFWMKEMNFPIDIIWIDEEWQIVGISPELPPESYPQSFFPPSVIKYVLEVNAGWAAKQAITIGNSVILKE